MRVGLTIWIAVAISVLALGIGWRKAHVSGQVFDTAAFDTAYVAPLAAPTGPLQVYHLGHSLVGRDMPAMLAQLAPEGHGYASQLGWGTSLREHWEPGLTINGFAAENAHPHFRDARDAIASGDYDTIILTEMVEIEDAIRHHSSADYLARWAGLARGSAPAPRLYLYETWHRLDDPKGWLDRLDADLPAAWEARILRPAHAPNEAPIYVIPVGQVMAALVRRVEAEGGVGPMRDRTDLFRRNDDGTQDMIHLGDLGNYLVALTHYAVLYHRSPEGVAQALHRADGSAAAPPDDALARMMQSTVWEAVTHCSKTGVAP